MVRPPVDAKASIDARKDSKIALLQAARAAAGVGVHVLAQGATTIYTVMGERHCEQHMKQGKDYMYVHVVTKLRTNCGRMATS